MTSGHAVCTGDMKGVEVGHFHPCGVVMTQEAEVIEMLTATFMNGLEGAFIVEEDVAEFAHVGNGRAGRVVGVRAGFRNQQTRTCDFLLLGFSFAFSLTFTHQ